jgi:hypothetical protein
MLLLVGVIEMVTAWGGAKVAVADLVVSAWLVAVAVHNRNRKPTKQSFFIDPLRETGKGCRSPDSLVE